MATTEQNLAIVEICQLKHAYAWSFDSQDVDALVEVFSADAVCDFGAYGSWQGSDEIRAGFTGTMANLHGAFAGIHAVSNPLIEVDDAGDSATGRWYLQDYVFGGSGDPVLKVIAIYHETYRHEGPRGWRIASSRVQFLWTHDHGRVQQTEP